jgi:hypothetical protein
MQNISYQPATEPLGHSAPMAYHARFAVLGIPVEFSTNSPAVIEVAAQAFAHWHGLAPELVAQLPPRAVRIVVQPGERPYVSGAPFTHRAHSGCWLATCGESMLVAQLDRGEALAFVVPELVADAAHFRYNVVESLALALASRHDRVPVHAGAVVYGGRAVLLMGQSTAGKSTLCYACVRDGFQLLAEDVIYVSLAGGLRMWGHSRHIHLLPDAPRHFGELAGVAPRVQANGKLKLAIDVAALGADRLRLAAEEASVCVLQRGDGPGSLLEPIAADEVLAMLRQGREPGFDLFQDVDQVAAALVRGGTYRLTVGSDLSRAVGLVRRLAGGGGG